MYFGVDFDFIAIKKLDGLCVIFGQVFVFYFHDAVIGRVLEVWDDLGVVFESKFVLERKGGSFISIYKLSIGRGCEGFKGDTAYFVVGDFKFSKVGQSGCCVYEAAMNQTLILLGISIIRLGSFCRRPSLCGLWLSGVG